MLLLSTCLGKESARVHFRELWNGLPATETQRQLVPDTFLRKKKLTPAHKIKGCRRGDCSTGKGRSSQQPGIMCNLSVHHGKGVGSMFLVGHAGEQAHTGTSEGLSEKKKASSQAKIAVEGRGSQAPPKSLKNAFTRANLGPLRAQRAEGTA